MTDYKKVAQLLAPPISKGDEELIIYLLKYGLSPFAIVSLITRETIKKQILKELSKLNISNLTDDELRMLEELLGSGDSVEEIVTKLKNQRFNDVPAPKSKFKPR